MPSRLTVLLGLALLVSTAGELAAQLQAGPVLLEIVPGANATRLTLRNPGSEPVAAQIRVYTWTQVGGEDRLVESDEIAASPPILTVPAGGSHLVRLVRLGPPAEGRDRSFRVVIDELPPEPSAGTVALRMRYVMPLFVRAPGAEPPRLSCAIDAETVRLICENRGGRAAQLGQTRLVGLPDGPVTLSSGLFGYVLPGMSRAWVLPIDGYHKSAGELEVEIETTLNGEPTTLPVAPPS